MRLPDTWLETRLGEALNRVETKVDPQTSAVSSHFYVGLEHIESHTGRLLRGAEDVTEGVDILSIKTAYQKGDILYGKLRPNLNKVYLAEQDGICSTDIWALRASNEVLPEFALHYLRSPAIHIRASQLATGANLPRIPANSFDRILLPLPTLPEQQRIVEVFRQAEEVAKAKRSISDQIDQLMRTLYWEHFGAWYTADGLRDPVRVSEYVDDSQYGVSDAMDEHGSHAVLRMNSITTSGWLDLSDLKYANLSKKDAENTTLQSGDLLFNRTNSRELVGKCAIWRDTKGVFSFASYLIRLRLKEGMLPEYLWATLNSTYGKYRLMNAAKQAVSMSNVSPTDLGRITVPLPPLALQEKFVLLVRQIEVLREEMLGKLELFQELQALVTGQALLGDITSSWREQHSEEIMNAANARNEALRARGARIHTSVVEIPSPDIFTEHSSDHIRPARRWLIDELSVFQRQVLQAFIAYPEQPLLAEDSDRFEDFCRFDGLAESLVGFSYSPNRIRRTLGQLAALGLIGNITLPKSNPLTFEREYLKVFRPLREDESTRLKDVDVLRSTLSANKSKEVFYFEVMLDYITSANVGASGLFQVIELTDDEGNDRTSLVDQGMHFSSMQALAIEIAKVLGVSAEQIELDEVGEVSE